MRLFIAIEIPEWAKRQLIQLQDSNLGVRWSSPGTMHLTLRFIGNVDDPGQKEKLVQKLSSVQVPAFELTLKGLGYFPPQKHPKVLWAGVKENDTLLNLQEQVEQLCVEAGFKPDDRPYTPHVTIGRVKGASKKEVNSFIKQHKKFRVEAFEVDEFILFESKLDSEGVRHSPLQRFGLTSQPTKHEA
ncbi:MAG: RNA 2',3'-cyclic phosphodiesterase [Balneolaceae bacterium]|nr:RNA 2',3'-cyclic phosphodiesterase [Balneolaceae bacterium]